MPQEGPSVKLKEIIEQFHLEILRSGENFGEYPLRTADINRPGLPLTGFFDHFDEERLLVIGLVETTYLSKLTPDERRKSFDRLLAHPVPGLIITRGIEPFPECMEMAEKYDRTILRTQEATSVFTSSLIGSLRLHMAPRLTCSGVMLEVYGEGVLIQGESGVGKSEVAIELIKRGHRIIADDAVEIYKDNAGNLVATAPELIRHYMELRGIGVIDVRRLFGMGAIKDSQEIDFVVHLEAWKEGKVYDRLGMENNYTDILDTPLPSVTIPVKPGRNLASILEVAAMNNRNRKMGHNAALELSQRMDEYFRQTEGNDL
ncbi:MAG: HPr(Ser) kinase/phosphatase [Oscillospiraceae bacterium]|nr:HPr(Ser) kinase/phosphatase [Oscillospiraceae bacterium]